MGTSAKACPFRDCRHYRTKRCKGITKHGFDRKGRQRYRCNLTGRTYSEATGSPYSRFRTPRETIDRAVALRSTRKSIRKAAREAGVNPKSVVRWCKRLTPADVPANEAARSH